jgi:hypothetical protein
MRSNARAVVWTVVAVVILGVLPVLWIARGGGHSDVQLVRGWFMSSAGGGASSNVASAIHVDDCRFTSFSTAAGSVLMCTITTDNPSTHPLQTCFVFSGDKAVRGGWQLGKLGGCGALRYDRASGELVDAPAHARYRVTA